MLMNGTDPENMQSFMNECEKCGGEGWYPVDIEGQEAVKPCNCLELAKERIRIQKLFKSAKIPKRYRLKTLDNFNKSWQPKAFEKAKAYLENWDYVKEYGNSIFFVGSPGTGKSHLVFAIMNGLIKKGVPGMSVTVPDLMEELRPKNNDNKESERMKALKEVEFLVLDDLGAEKETPWTTEKIYIILNARYSEMKPTAITSNDYLEDLEKREGWKRIVDRIKEMCELVAVEGKSYREQIRRQKKNAS